jgi:pimeloyl-ACP methyl ester carboxylesterase
VVSRLRRVLLDGSVLGSGATGVVLAHESPADLCGWLPYARVLSHAGFRVLLFDHRHFGLSESPSSTGKAGRFVRDLEGAVDELKREGAKKVFLMGAARRASSTRRTRYPSCVCRS